jgi:hypothetical protein
VQAPLDHVFITIVFVVPGTVPYTEENPHKRKNMKEGTFIELILLM